HLFVKGLFDGEHYFLLSPDEKGGTRFVHGEHFRGLLSGLIFKLIGQKTERAFIKMNKALKQRCEF
nr:SRPBCC domain-containing protein [Saprospiraceae bacterium]